MLSIEDFIITVFCLVDDWLHDFIPDPPLRSRGFEPAVSDSEVIAMESIGEFPGFDTDKGIWSYFRRHWLPFFPRLSSRSTFVRQAANLWALKARLQQRLSSQMGAVSDTMHLVDGLPIPVCRFTRANSSRVFRGEAAYGYCAPKDEVYYGFHGNLLISSCGICTAFTLTCANADEREALWELLPGMTGLLIGDKGYFSQRLKDDLLQCGIDLQTVLRANMHDERPKWWLKTLLSTRRLVETVIGQLAERFHIEKVRARELWHQTSRLIRKLLSHTVAVFINQLLQREPLLFDHLVAQ